MALPLIPIALGIAKFIPDIIRYLGGKNGNKAASLIVDVAESVTGKKGDKIEEALKNSPELVFELQKAIVENEHVLDKYHMQDRIDARNRDIKIKKMGYRNTRADIMIVVAGVALCLDIYLIWSTPEMPAGILAIFNMMVGSLLKMLGDAFAFEFGSSRGSKEKDLKS